MLVLNRSSGTDDHVESLKPRYGPRNRRRSRRRRSSTRRSCRRSRLQRGIVRTVLTSHQPSIPRLTHIQLFSRLAPEHPDPALINDCYAGLKYFSAHASEFGVDNNRIAVYGPSAGGGLAAGTALKARDEKLEPALAFECLIYPMLDDRNVSKSSEQIVNIGIWDRCDAVRCLAVYFPTNLCADPV